MNLQHVGVILREGKGGSWDCRGASWCCAYKCDDGTLYLYYSGFGEERDGTEWSIGLAKSKDGLSFNKVSEPILEHSSFCSFRAWTPAVFRFKNRFFMIFAGSPRRGLGGRIGIAWADDPEGPFKTIREILRPELPWEGVGIDLGPNVLSISEDEFLFYYSNHSISRREQYLNMIRLAIRRGIGAISREDRYRYVRRRIGIAKIRIRGLSKWSIEVYRYEGNPLKHLNGSLGEWNESLFCPGCLKVGKHYYLFPATSTYSIGFPYKQYIGLMKSELPYFKSATKGILINGEKERASIMPSAKSQLALDTPSPVLNEDGEVSLYYSVMDRDEGIWRVALSKFHLAEINI